MESKSGPGGGKVAVTPKFTEVSVHGPLGRFVRHPLQLKVLTDTQLCYVCQRPHASGKSMYACQNPECDLHVCVACRETETHLVIQKRNRSTTPVLSGTSTTTATTAATTEVQVTRERSVTPVMPQA
jgi:hypothetical protein